MAHEINTNQLIAIGLVGLLVLLGLFIVKNIIIAIFSGLLLAYVFHPVYKKINKKVKQKDIATSLLILGIILVIAIPLVFLIPMVIRETFETHLFLQNINFVEPFKKILPMIFTEEFSRAFAVNINNILSKVFSVFLSGFTDFLVNIPKILLQFVVILFTFYFATRDSEKLKHYAIKLSPFSNSTQKKFLEEFRNVTDSVVYGQVLIGIIQGLALGAGLFVLGVPKVIILMVIATIVSIIPVLGSWLVWLPVGIFLLLSGHVITGIILLLYGALFVSTIDNILRPILISKKSHLPVVVIILGIIGGLYTFGIIGIVLGPLILAYILIIVDFYNKGRINELFKTKKRA